MIGINVALRSSAGGQWWPTDAHYYADFTINRYMRSDAEITQANAITVSRATAKLADNVSGDWQSFAIDELARTNKGALIEPASTRLAAYPSTPFTHGTNVSAINSAEAGTFLGIFSDAVSVASNGQLWQRFAMNGSTGAAAVTSGRSTSVTCIYKVGSSGKMHLRIGNGSTGSRMMGTAASPEIINYDAGGIDNIQHRQFGDVWITSFEYTPNLSDDVTIELGPRSEVVGEDIIGIAAWIESNATPTSPVLDNISGQFTRAADNVVLHFPAGTFDLDITFDDDSQQTLNAVSGDYTLPTNLDRAHVKRISAFLA